MTKLTDLAPSEIRQNVENPRLHFPKEGLDALAASIDAVGILVPISVYEDPERGSPPYVLIDGERRWRTAGDLGLATIPAIVMDPPDSTQNLKSMFNIHMVREQWKDMPTAWALRKLMERTGLTSVEELHELTGLSQERLKRLLFALTLPQRYQDLIDSEEIPLNFFYELERNVVGLLERERPAIFEKYGRERLLEIFVDKRLASVTPDTVELRQMRPIIRTAAQEAETVDGPSDLDAAIEDLIDTPERTIQEAYENTVEMVVEAGKFARQCDHLLARLDRLLRKAASDEDRQTVIVAVRALHQALEARLPEASGQ